MSEREDEIAALKERRLETADLLETPQQPENEIMQKNLRATLAEIDARLAVLTAEAENAKI